MTPEQRAAHCRAIAGRGGQAPYQAHGREHMARIGTTTSAVTPILPAGIVVDTPVVVWLEGADDEASAALFDRFVASRTLLPQGDGSRGVYLLASQLPLLHLQIARYTEELRRAGDDAGVSLGQRPLAAADALTVAAVLRGEAVMRRGEESSRRVARVHPTADALDLFIETAINGTVEFALAVRDGAGMDTRRTEGTGRLRGPRCALLAYRPSRTLWSGAPFPARTVVEALVYAFNALFVPPADAPPEHRQTRRRLSPRALRRALERRRRRCSNLFHAPFTRRGVRRCGKTAVMMLYHELWCADCDPGRDWSPSQQQRVQARGLRRSLR